MGKKSFAFSVFTFICGVLVGRSYINTSQTQIRTNEALQKASSNGSSQASAQITSTKPSLETQPIKDTSRSAVSPRLFKSPEINIAQLKRPVPILDQGTESQLNDMIRSSLPVAKQPDQKSAPDGSIDAYGLADDGKSIFRHFNSHGDLTQEGWIKTATGEQIFRTYYDNGELKQFVWRRTDQSVTTISFTQSGLHESRIDQLSNGTSTSTTYDESGEIKDIWKTEKDGKPHKIYP